ncbi:glycosyl transferase family 2 [Lujinxingia litoralis]|uniref:Glycosyl transferase family 2 n=1 Tax=Lujinxingia litoralis TaxID=2211119 RepID=A0A328C6T1_9DELT|nr:cellulose synthase family protein [Lujinxingia litoralis]RAL20224.1 glycosyl transferase family 2 [Lujinxingia litoralis]
MSHFQDYNLWQLAILLTYFAVLLMLSFYGSHRYAIVHLYRKYASGPDPEPAARFTPETLPVVTVQLPSFNERYVIERLIDATCQLDYPRDRLEIQVLDDSTDDTTALIRDRVAHWRDRGINISLLHRTDRQGFKAGALQAGLEQARGELVAVLDADFIPQPEFLRQTIDHFTEPDIGMVQARWDYINRDYSLLTRAQAVLLDGHFVLEHTARNRSGRFFNFNGTAGIWRRQAIEDAGGWEHHTLTEDLDLSYRAQLAGWRFRFLRDVTVMSELPVEMNAFKSQQHRWSKGALQTAFKVLPRVLRSPQPRAVKLEAIHHLTGNLAYLLMVILALIMPLATLVRVQQGWYEVLLFDLPIFLSATFSVCYFYWVSQRELGRPRWEILRLMPAVLALGIGVSVNNAKGVIEVLLGHKTPFVRTPKYAIQRAGESWSSRLYRGGLNAMPAIEFALGIWFSYAIYEVLADPRHPFGSLPFLMLFQFGFFYVAFLSVSQTLGSRPEPPASPSEQSASR